MTRIEYIFNYDINYISILIGPEQYSRLENKSNRIII